ncbi:PREDICTED: uncharacterized protein LOC109234713 [Nicotiana attenuata]|uniref:uncharacterized protein LOC109234713 n=1 Tax=Nicotiana attenuata TaxID=49451 RepID=UPI000904E471|nr:PREDICTED: uncharacterized protein LOC109234713 [Nicotiana attenuata]
MDNCGAPDNLLDKCIKVSGYILAQPSGLNIETAQDGTGQGKLIAADYIVAECWLVKISEDKRSKMRMLRWICEHNKIGRTRNEDIRAKLGVALVEDKTQEATLRLLGHMKRSGADYLGQLQKC